MQGNELYHLFEDDANWDRVITDNEYHHALRIYRDRSTGTLRLEAAVLEGSMKE